MDEEYNIQNIATLFTAIYTVINIFRVTYHIQVARTNELNAVVKDAVQYVWDTYVYQRKKSDGVWNNLSKIEASNRAYEYVKSRINLCCLADAYRVERLIKEEVNNRKNRYRRSIDVV